MCIFALWVNIGLTLDQLWINFGSTLDQLRINFGSTLDQPWINFGSTFPDLGKDPLLVFTDANKYAASNNSDSVDICTR